MMRFVFAAALLLALGPVLGMVLLMMTTLRPVIENNSSEGAVLAPSGCIKS